ncbi:hypothetical protein DOTSEDRAFT_24230 [Dothistroma septosporum NZE10]|uniref:Uncharacterized protein n=1 Tax=Dothistroma septosporum (strain NZE10 / CBS 128990) TaxID=675120 RepID=N1PMI9_DOTSN|nr:hypothetical protein DOTSEDRAFT_24230 [Dothistroma septosporum NZE10]
MVYLVRTLTILAILLAVLLAPQLASEAYSDASVFSPEPHVCREKVLDYHLILDVPSSRRGNLDALRVDRNGHWMGAIHAQPSDTVQLRGPNGLRNATVTANTPQKFVYRETAGPLQRIEHTLSFDLFTAHTGQQTLVKYKREWRGNVLILLLRQIPSLKGFVGEGLPSSRPGGVDGLKDAISKASGR